MIFHDVEQNSNEWMQLRQGKFTASMFCDLFAKPSTQQYIKAHYKVVYERLTNESPESFSNDYMKRGHEIEPLARRYYELENFQKVHNGGFFEVDDEFQGWIGASPDGLIGTDGILEIKSPAYNTMIEYLLNKELPNQYFWQVHGQLYVTGRQWCDFLAYHPSLPKLPLRIFRDEEIIKTLKLKLKDSIQYAENILQSLKKAA